MMADVFFGVSRKGTGQRFDSAIVKTIVYHFCSLNSSRKMPQLKQPRLKVQRI